MRGRSRLMITHSTIVALGLAGILPFCKPSDDTLLSPEQELEAPLYEPVVEPMTIDSIRRYERVPLELPLRQLVNDGELMQDIPQRKYWPRMWWF